MLRDYEYLDFNTIKEDWNKYKIEDGTQLKVKIIMVKILRRKIEGGYDFRFNHNKVFGIDAPLDKSGPPSNKKYTPKELQESLVATDMNFESKGEIKWNEYVLTKDKTKIFVRPEIVTIHKSSKYDEYGDPIYSIQLQPIFKSIPIKKR